MRSASVDQDQDKQFKVTLFEQVLDPDGSSLNWEAVQEYDNINSWSHVIDIMKEWVVNGNLDEH